MPLHRATLPIFGVTIFLGAGLMFLLQLIFARMVLPLLGGSPAVWNTAMLFYQAVLLAGYAYAHWLGTKFRLRTQVALHCSVLLVAALALPPEVPAGWIPPAGGNPIPWLLGLLAFAVGAPFFAISATSPLLQRWFSASGHPDARDPYFLYAASNAGSLLGLLGYPLLIEPNTTLAWQAGAWAVGFVSLVLLSAVCGLLVRGREQTNVHLPMSPPEKNIGPARKWRWAACAMVPSSLMLSMTSYISSEIAAVPLLWVLPLALYLLTFIVVFSRRPFIPRTFANRLLPVLLVAVVMVIGMETTTPIVLLAGLHLAGFFVAALACHGRMAADRPEAENLTAFYLWMSFGGVLGGCFNALLAPVLFDGLHEYPVMLAAAAWLGLGGGKEAGSLRHILTAIVPAAVLLVLAFALPSDPGLRFVRNLAVFGVPALLCFLMSRHAIRFAVSIACVLLASRFAPEQGMTTLAVARSFFGIHRVASDGKFHYLFHGKTVHGIQARDPVQRQIPLSYYHPGGPLGQIFESREFGPVAAVGLGAGAAAMYGRPGQSFTFYEIDPAVIRIARDSGFFTYLSDSPARVEFVTGDARLKLGEPRDHSDLIILDAYGSDSVPVHLLTREALAIYLGRLSPRGMIAFHLSNLHLDLRPVIANLAADAGVPCLFQEDADFSVEEAAAGRAPSRWAVIARTRTDLEPLAKSGRWEELEAEPRSKLWTDDYSSIVPLLDLRGN